MWDQRYSGADYVFGVDPNRFLTSCAHLLEPGQSALAVADGEGRNSVWLASEGLNVTAFDASEIGLSKAGRLAAEITRLNPTLEGRVEVLDDGDFTEIEARASDLKPDLLIGHSKGYPTSRRLDIPLVRVGLPIHDRVGGQRIKHLGYRGAQDLLDRVVNTVIQRRQDTSTVGYAYM